MNDEIKNELIPYARPDFSPSKFLGEHLKTEIIIYDEAIMRCSKKELKVLIDNIKALKYIAARRGYCIEEVPRDLLRCCYVLRISRMEEDHDSRRVGEL